MRTFDAMLRAICASLVLLTTQAGAVCLNPFGCAPKNYDECIDEATKRPTAAGVALARDACYQRFRAAEDQRKAEAAKQAEAKAVAQLSERWKTMGVAIRNKSDAVGALGSPNLSYTAPCSRLKGKLPDAGPSCLHMQWEDRTPGRICFKSSTTCHFQAEFDASQAQQLWAWWEESQ